MDNEYNLVAKKALLVRINNDILINKINNNNLMEYDKIFFCNNKSEVDTSFAALWIYEKELFKRLTNKELTDEQVKKIIKKINENLGFLIIMFIAEGSENINSPYGEYSCMQKIKKQQKND